MKLNSPLSKVPPHNVEAEQATLAAMFISPGCIPKVQKTLNPDDFYREAHQSISEDEKQAKKENRTGAQ